ncbi:MAG: carboxypeptidase M32 [Chloroflexota bacterium]|nr:MAG: carboxypeptidase M32 [Chloroflexota bacterium]
MPAVQARDTTATLEALRALSAELYDLGRIAEVLGWDQETMMPARGIGPRSLQQATIQGIYHEKLISPRLGDMLIELGDAADDDRSPLTDVERGLIRETRRERDRAVKLPTELVKELAHATSAAMHAWQQAREQADFAIFREDLTRIMGLKRQVADLIGFKESAYDALLDEYEPGMTARQLRALFDTVRTATVGVLDLLRTSPRPPSRAILEKSYSLDGQWAFGKDIIQRLGFDFEAGRVDQSTHPFCVHFGASDVRLTTRGKEHDLAQLLFGNIHEAGHGMYEQGIGEAVQRSAIGSGVSLGMHESQSRLWENFIGRGLPFWKYAFPRLRDRFPEQLRGADPETLWRAVNVVEPSHIRVEADEVTYNLHIILRFEIERRLFDREITVDEIPEAWSAFSRELLGVTPPDVAAGPLQDIHWSFGLVGYFPTYTLGNVFAAQLWDAIGRDIPDRDARIERGDFASILGWLRERIHRHGGTYLPIDLIRRATGSEPDARHLTDYLTTKFSAVYGL